MRRKEKMSDKKCKFCSINLRAYELQICDQCKKFIEHGLPITLMEKLIERIERLEEKMDGK